MEHQETAEATVDLIVTKTVTNEHDKEISKEII